MKRLIGITLCVAVLFTVIACSRMPAQSEQQTSASSETNNQSSHVNQITADNSANITHVEKDDQNIGGRILPKKYRNDYYTVPAFFADLVDRELFNDWEAQFLKEYEDKDQEEMMMPAYVQAFHITREQFDKANLKYTYFIIEHQSAPCYEPQDFADQEMAEPYNADIIYTFDNDVINDYYLGIDYPFMNEYQYLEALEAGTYQTRTTKWVDVDEMEAEILAKYGSLD